MTDDNHIPPADVHIARMIFHIMLGTRAVLERHIAPFGLTFRQAMLLLRCVRKGSAHLHEFAPDMHTDNAGVSRLADRLEAAGFVTRVPGNDRRSIILAPTPKGIAIHTEIEQALGDADRELLAGLSDEDAERFRGTLHHILANVRRSNTDTMSKE